MAGDDRLTPRQRQAAALLASGLPPAVVAERVGASARTLRRWRARPAFQALLRELEREALEDHVRRLRGLLGGACAALERALTSEDLRVATKAAEVALGAALRWLEAEDLARRVEELERRLEEATQGAGRPASQA